MQIGFVLFVIPLSIRKGACSSHGGAAQDVVLHTVSGSPRVVRACHDGDRDKHVVTECLQTTAMDLRLVRKSGAARRGRSARWRALASPALSLASHRELGEIGGGRLWLPSLLHEADAHRRNEQCAVCECNSDWRRTESCL